MSGAPVRRLADDVVVGVVCARYNSADGWLAHSVWVAGTGSTHDLTAARSHGVIGAATRADVELLADKGFQGRWRDRDHATQRPQAHQAQKAHNRMVNSVRGPGERGFATLKAWRILTKVRCCPQRVGALAKAVLTLELGPES